MTVKPVYRVEVVAVGTGDKRVMIRGESALLVDKRVKYGSCGEGDDNDKLQ